MFSFQNQLLTQFLVRNSKYVSIIFLIEILKSLFSELLTKNILSPRKSLLSLKHYQIFRNFFDPFTQPTLQIKIGVFCKKSVTFDERCFNPLSSKLLPGCYDLLASDLQRNKKITFYLYQGIKAYLILNVQL